MKLAIFTSALLIPIFTFCMEKERPKKRRKVVEQEVDIENRSCIDQSLIIKTYDGKKLEFSGSDVEILRSTSKVLRNWMNDLTEIEKGEKPSSIKLELSEEDLTLIGPFLVDVYNDSNLIKEKVRRKLCRRSVGSLCTVLKIADYLNIPLIQKYCIAVIKEKLLLDKNYKRYQNIIDNLPVPLSNAIARGMMYPYLINILVSKIKPEVIKVDGAYEYHSSSTGAKAVRLYNGRAEIWDLLTRKCISVIHYDSDNRYVTAIFSWDGSKLAVAHLSKNRVAICDASSGKCIKELSYGKDLTFSPDGSHVGIKREYNTDETLTIYQVSPWRAIEKILMPRGSISLSRYGTLAICRDKEIYIRSLTRETFATLQIDEDFEGIHLTNGGFICKSVFLEDKLNFSILNLSTGKSKAIVVGPGFLCVALERAYKISPCGLKMLTMISSQNCTLWDLQEGKFIKKFMIFDYQVAFSPDGSLLAWVSHPNKRVEIWDLTTNSLAYSLKCPRLYSSFTIKFISDSQLLWIDVISFYIWDLKKRSKVRKFLTKDLLLPQALLIKHLSSYYGNEDHPAKKWFSTLPEDIQHLFSKKGIQYS